MNLGDNLGKKKKRNEENQNQNNNKKVNVVLGSLL